jgi:23S rRNA pseudouridine2457 synthase
MPNYLLFNKPYDVLTQFTDGEGRQTLSDFIDMPGVYAAGRLDRNSEGLLLLSDDGEILHRVTHPRWKLPKVYLAQVEGIPTPEALQQLRSGVIIKGERTAPAQVELLARAPNVPPREVRHYHPTPWLRVVLKEGKKRQIRRMTAAVGFPTLRLIRVAIGPLTLGNLSPGQWRQLTETQRRTLFRALGLDPDKPTRVGPKPRRPRRPRQRRPRR